MQTDVVSADLIFGTCRSWHEHHGFIEKSCPGILFPEEGLVVLFFKGHFLGVLDSHDLANYQLVEEGVEVPRPFYEAAHGLLTGVGLVEKLPGALRCHVTWAA